MEVDRERDAMATKEIVLLFKSGYQYSFPAIPEELDGWNEKLNEIINADNKLFVIVSLHFRSSWLFGWRIIDRRKDETDSDLYRKFMQKAIEQLDEGEKWKAEE